MDNEQLIGQIIDREWTMFDKVRSVGGRAGCQDDWGTFSLQRRAQFRAWDAETLASYREDLEEAEKAGRNLLTEKYAYMMERTDPEAYAGMAGLLPETGAEKWAVIRQIMDIQMAQTREFAGAHMKFMRRARPVGPAGDAYFTSIETYDLGELRTYSVRTLKAYLRNLEALRDAGVNMTQRIFENAVKQYGYPDIAACERAMK